MEPAHLPLCPRCGEPRILAPECPRCGVLYARARARTAPPAPPAREASLPTAAPPENLAGSLAVFANEPARALVWDGDLEEARHELRLRTWALPLALGVMGVITGTGMGRTLTRTFLSMWIHELGHASTAWFCGFPALPGPWKTSVGAERSSAVFALVAFLCMGALFRGVLLRHRAWILAGASGLVLQFLGSVCVSSTTSQMLITFGGDGGSFVLGTLLMLTLYASPRSAIRRDWLHWGFLTLGAASFVDTFREWWAARNDFAEMTFGVQEGNLTDTSKLVDQHGWSEEMLIQRYLTLAFTCLAVLAVTYLVGLWRARATLKRCESFARPAS